MKHERMPSAHPRRRALQRLALACTALAVPALWAAAPAGRIPVEVWKDPNCGCCQDWVAHMEHNGFAVTVHDTGNSAVRTRLGIPARLGYRQPVRLAATVTVGEGCIDVDFAGSSAPSDYGINVPGMPVGSPGMDGPEYGGRKDPYEVLLITKNLMNSDVSTRTFTSYR
jgi:hypothetical protein